jgi:hypothetical protein
MSSSLSGVLGGESSTSPSSILLFLSPSFYNYITIVAVLVPQPGRKKPQSVLPNRAETLDLTGKGRDKAEPVSNPAERSICDPHDKRRRSASAEAGLEPRGARTEHSPQRAPGGSGASIKADARNARSQPPRELTGHAALPNKQHKERVYPRPLDSASREEHTS